MRQSANSRLGARSDTSYSDVVKGNSGRKYNSVLKGPNGKKGNPSQNYSVPTKNFYSPLNC